MKTEKCDLILRARAKSWIIQYVQRNSTLRKSYLPRVPCMVICVSVHTLRHTYATNPIFLQGDMCDWAEKEAGRDSCPH